MIGKSPYLITCTLILLFSCNNRPYNKCHEYLDEKGRLSKREYLDENGNVLWEENIDSLGYKFSEMKWINNKRTGSMYFYYPSGKLRQIAYYINDNYNGSFINYYESGIVKSRGYYRKSKRFGNLLHYDIKGRVEQISQMEDGECMFYGNIDTLGKPVSGDVFLKIGMLSDTIYSKNQAVFYIKTYNSQLIDSAVVLFSSNEYNLPTVVNLINKDSITLQVSNLKLGENLLQGVYKTWFRPKYFSDSLFHLSYPIYQPFFVRDR